MARRIAVIGGGLAGISAALRCSRAGASVVLLESRGRLGGAAYSFDRDGLRVDNGQHVFLRCCSAYRDLLADLVATEMVTLQRRLRIPVLAPGGLRATLNRSNLPAPLHLAGAIARYRLLSASDRLAVARAMAALRRVDCDDFANDAVSFGDWLAAHGQSSDAVENLWQLIARPTLNLDPADASLAQAAQVFQVGLLRGRSAADVGYASVPLSEIHDVAARRALTASGVDVRLRRAAAAIVPAEHGFKIESARAALEADTVIIAVPPDRAAQLLPEGSGIAQTNLTGLGRSPIVNLHVVYDRGVLDVPFAAAVRSPVQWIFDRTSSAGLEDGRQYLAVSLSAADRELSMNVGDLRARYVPALGKLLGTDARPQKFFVTREHSATFRAEPGARALRPGVRTAIPGLLVAGSWTDTGWPATMEGAVRSGNAAARQALIAALAPTFAAPGGERLPPRPNTRPTRKEVEVLAGGREA